MQRFSEEIKTALEPCEPELSEYLGIDEGILAALKHVLDELASEGKRILVVLDSFDCVPFGTQVTRTLLDNLRSLAVLSSLTLVTGSRRLPREVCRTAAVDSSPFWNIFYPEPIRITALVESDWRLFLEPFRAAGHTLDASAEKEITNWTGGVPVLTCALLRKLLDQRPNRSLSGNDINEAAKELLGELRETLKILWDDCSPDLRTDLETLANNGSLTLTGLADDRNEIVARGFGRRVGKQLRASCRLIEHYAAGQAPTRAELNRLFGNSHDFETNIGSLLELRLKQFASPSVDGDLKRFVSNAVEGLIKSPDHKDALTWLQRIVERALTLIWDAELEDGKRLPRNWTEEWEGAYASFRAPDGILPEATGQQLNLLRLATGTDRTQRRTQYVTKKTYLSVEHLKSVRDIVDHSFEYPEIQNVSVGFVVAVILDAISLLENLADELPRR